MAPLLKEWMRTLTSQRHCYLPQVFTPACCFKPHARFNKLFLKDDARIMRERVGTAASKLREALAGARISAIIEGDPELLFLDARLDWGE